MTSIKYLVTCLLLIASTGVFAAGAPTFTLPYGQWRMISLPATPPGSANTLEKILGDDMGKNGKYGENWIVYGYNTESNKYGDPLKKEDKLEKGRGYWIIQLVEKNEPVTLKMPSGSTVTPDSTPIPLTHGSNQWNLAGNPFATSLALGNVRLKTNAPSCNGDNCTLDTAKDNNLIHNKVWIYDDNGYVIKGTSDELGAWNGFWVAALDGSKDYPLALAAKANAKANIFLVGDSTVHNDGRNFLLQGWGDKIHELVKNKVNLVNRARAGSSSQSYINDIGQRRNWNYIKGKMEDADKTHGAYLLIQFGHNDEHEEDSQPGRGNSFYKHLKFYTDMAIDLNVTPVLVTSVSRSYKNDISHEGYHQTVRALAEDKNILLLDLQHKSWTEFNKKTSDADVHRDFGFEDIEHFNSKGALIVANWIKELICNSEDLALCSQFKE